MNTKNRLPQPLTQAEYEEAENLTKEFFSKEIAAQKPVEFPLDEIEMIRNPRLRRLDELVKRQFEYVNWVRRSQRWN
jgi:hypothetical protein